MPQSLKRIFTSFGIGFAILAGFVLLGLLMKLIPTIMVVAAFVVVCYYIGELVKQVRRVRNS